MATSIIKYTNAGTPIASGSNCTQVKVTLDSVWSRCWFYEDGWGVAIGAQGSNPPNVVNMYGTKPSENVISMSGKVLTITLRTWEHFMVIAEAGSVIELVR